MIRVVVPTCNRPNFLSKALQSIRDQKNRDVISSVIVSENSPDSQSRNICDAFRDLPIQYTHRQPAVSVLEHFRLLFLDDILEPYTAILHDDDWWSENHISESLAAIQPFPETSACFSNFLETRGPEYPPTATDKAIRVWIATGADFSKPLLQLDVAGVIAANLIEATFHYTTLFARTSALQFAIGQMLKTNNPFDNDRVVPIFLAERGAVAFRTQLSAWIRFHQNQDSERDEYQQHNNELKAATTCWIRNRWPQEHREAVRRLNSALADVGTDWVARISRMPAGEQKKTLISESGLQLQPDPVIKRSRGAKWLIKQFVPHGVLTAYQLIASQRARSNR